MRYFFNFLLRNHFVIVFLILETIAVYLTINNHTYHHSVTFAVSGEITGRLDNMVNNITEYLRLKEANTGLARENARLRAMLPADALKKYRQVLSKSDTFYKQQYQYVPAKVISNSVTRRNNYIMLDKGLLDGIRPDMAVISPDGIVGIVTKVSANFAWVNSVLHKQTKISAKIKKNGFVGTITWDGKHYQQGSLNDIPANVLIKKGDTIVTSGYSHIYPAGIMVGKIREFSVDKGYNFYNITIDFTQDYNKLAYVYVVINLFKEEQMRLEQFKVDE